MHVLFLMLCLLAPPAGESETAAPKPDDKLAPLRRMYREDALKYEFHRSEIDAGKLELLPQPIMRWEPPAGFRI